MVGPLTNVHYNSKEVVEVIGAFAVVRGVAQLQLKGKDHPVVQLPHPVRQGTHMSTPVSGDENLCRPALTPRRYPVLALHKFHSQGLQHKGGAKLKSTWPDTPTYTSGDC